MNSNKLCSGGEAELLAAEIANNLGIKHCRKLVITMEHDKLFTVEAILYPEIDGLKNIVPVMKKFNLQVVEVADTSEFGNEYDSFDFKKRSINETEGSDIIVKESEIADAE